jgi:predicted phage baseplate assembly protein
MSKLTPNLFQRRFQDFVEIGRARLPSLAPDWTDHNAHDPGITLMELLAWTAEAQLYSLATLRRDERMAYGALLGLTASGTRGARGLIWPDRLDAASPVRTFLKNVVLAEDAVINVLDGETPTFRPVHKLLWVPGRITKLETRGPKGRTTDHTITNERGGLPFLPFGELTGRREVLALTFECRDNLGLFGLKRQEMKGALWPIGVLVAPPYGDTEALSATQSGRSSLSAMLVTDDGRFALKIASDSTEGLLTTGVLLLDLDKVPSPANKLNEFTIEFRSPRGFARPPRVLRIEPNAIPIQQGRTFVREPHVANGLPDWTFRLDVEGLRFSSGEEPIKLEVDEPASLATWTRCDRLSEHGPDGKVYQLDVKTGELTFGNGVNGRIPPAGSQALVTYSVSDGEKGEVARNRKWKVAGFAGAFGVNPDPVAGGAPITGWIDERREARRRSRDDHALVSSDDIEAAARALTLLEVARAWIPALPDRAPRTGAVTLVALRSRPAGKEPEEPPETVRWLEAIGRSLTARMPLASRLVVMAPRYVEFSVEAVVETDAGRNPAVIKKNIEAELQQRLALIELPKGMPPRQPGVPVTRRDITAWIRSVDGVKRVIQLQLQRADGKNAEKEITVPRDGLPRWDFAGSTIEVRRPESGRSR